MERLIAVSSSPEMRQVCGQPLVRRQIYHLNIVVSLDVYRTSDPACGSPIDTRLGPKRSLAGSSKP